MFNAQDPDKLKVLDWIDLQIWPKNIFLSFYRKGAAWSGKLIFINPDEAKKFMYKVEANDDYPPNKTSTYKYCVRRKII